MHILKKKTYFEFHFMGKSSAVKPAIQQWILKWGGTPPGWVIMQGVGWEGR